MTIPSHAEPLRNLIQLGKSLKIKSIQKIEPSASAIPFKFLSLTIPDPNDSANESKTQLSLSLY
jgi:hypothetical protein